MYFYCAVFQMYFIMKQFNHKSFNSNSDFFLFYVYKDCSKKQCQLNKPTR